jgi:hypothetical protein
MRTTLGARFRFPGCGSGAQVCGSGVLQWFGSGVLQFGALAANLAVVVVRQRRGRWATRLCQTVVVARPLGLRW